MSLTSRLPHGVKLPATLHPDDARDLITHLAEHYGFAHLLFTLDEVEDHLAANPPTNHSEDRRRLSPDEWERLRNTDAWYHIPTAGHANAVQQIRAAIRQASLECTQCATALTGPPTATWGRCPTCLTGADLNELRRLPCPAAGADVPHHWGPAACEQCGMPAADTPFSQPRRLAAVPAAA
jgi:hypothetical protein